MAENIIKDFVKKQTSPISISVPKTRPEVQPEEKSVSDLKGELKEQLKEELRAELKEEMTAAPEADEKSGKTKAENNKVKLSLYINNSVKQKLIKIQHATYKSSLNDVLIEAVDELLKKYDM